MADQIDEVIVETGENKVMSSLEVKYAGEVIEVERKEGRPTEEKLPEEYDLESMVISEKEWFADGNRLYVDIMEKSLEDGELKPVEGGDEITLVLEIEEENIKVIEN